MKKPHMTQNLTILKENIRLFSSESSLHARNVQVNFVFHKTYMLNRDAIPKITLIYIFTCKTCQNHHTGKERQPVLGGYSRRN